MRLPAGPDNQVLSTDSTTPEGLKWALQASFFSFTEVTGTAQAMANNNEYITNNPVVVSAILPTVSSVGDLVRIVGKGVGGGMENRPECRPIHSLRQSRYDDRHRRLFGFDESI